MEINVTRKQEGAKLTLFVEGKLGVSSAPTLKNELVDLTGVRELVIDLEKVSYVASAGFRVFIEAYRKMEASAPGRLPMLASMTPMQPMK